ncbi:hypothetical protein EC957_011856 [Mortierella hygrophila]|uniref:VASt domain-containing protein n=1 Tax=Mortierella hygrophila TaxID=979708 RepID=A0A9P6F8T2_9FUNG|nr:hypothetical protein EC957_011856 [Mortierella hygrophila]
MMGSSQEQINTDAKAMQYNMQQPTMAHPPTAMKLQQPQPRPATAPTGYSIPSSAGSPFAAVIAAVAKTALAPVITTVASTMSAPTATATAVAITTLDQPSLSSTSFSSSFATSPTSSPSSLSFTSDPNSTSTSTSTLTLAPLPSYPLRPAQANSATATNTTSITATPSTATTATAIAPSPPFTSNSSATASSGSTIRLTSMTVDQSQWDHSPGGFPETLGHTNNAYSNNTQGYESTLSSKQSSLDYPRDDSFSHISFLYANEKRFGDFHSHFRTVPDDEKLIEDYGCALQKEILVQGRLYISENHVCFNANIFGWVTTLVIAFSEITAIEKRLTAFVIPNAIGIVTTTNTKGHFFASFLSRDAAHDLLMAAWRKSFPCAANASVANNSYSNGSSRQRSSTLVNDEDDNTDSMSFISGRGYPESRRNRHRRSFSNASQSATDVEGTGKEDGLYWGGDDNGDAKVLGSGNNSLRRRGSRRAVLKKVLKDVMAPIISDDSHNNAIDNGNGSNGLLSPNRITNGRKTGRGRSVSELPPRPASFDGSGSLSSADTARSSFDYESLSPPLQGARAGTESIPHRRNATVPVPILVVPTVTNTSTTPSLSIQQQDQQHQHQAQPASNRGITRSPTTCKCSKDNRHYANTYMSDTFPGTLESIWKLLFDSDFTKGFLTSDLMKGADVQEEPWQNAPDGTTTRVTRYTRWLGLPIGPKTTKAIVTDVCEHKDFDDYITVVTTTSTPDVPSGGSFTTKVMTCLSWAGPNQVLVVVTGAVEFSKSSWIKGQIEKGAAEGLTFHYKEVNPRMRKHIAAHPEVFANGSSVPAGQDTHATASISATLAAPVALSVDTNSHLNRVDQQAKVNQESRTQAPAANGGAKPSTATSGSSLGLLSKLAKALTWESGVGGSSSSKNGDEESDGTVSHWVLLMVLAIVMGANVYIWFQISSVSRQIEQIQRDILSVDRDHSYNYHGQHHHSPQKHWGSKAYDEADQDEFEREELFAREQEDAMWEWLTEREARHQRYRQATGVFSESRAKVDMTRRQQLLRDQERQQQQQRAQEFLGLTETELRLQARIDELQEQLMVLDRQASDIKIDSHHVEQEISFNAAIATPF